MPSLSHLSFFFFFFNDTATTEIYTLSLHDALPICRRNPCASSRCGGRRVRRSRSRGTSRGGRGPPRGTSPAREGVLAGQAAADLLYDHLSDLLVLEGLQADLAGLLALQQLQGDCLLHGLPPLRFCYAAFLSSRRSFRLSNSSNSFSPSVRSSCSAAMTSSRC